MNNNMYEQYNKYIWKLINDRYGQMSASEKEDLFQAGFEGMLRANKTFVPGEFTFLTYATPFIKKAIMKEFIFLKKNGIKTDSSFHNVIRSCLSNGIEDSETIASGMGVSVSKIEEAIKKIRASEQYEEYNDKDMNSLSEEGNPERSAIKKEQISEIVKCLDILPEEQRHCLVGHALDGKPFTLLAKECNIKPYQARSYYEMAICALIAQTDIKRKLIA